MDGGATRREKVRVDRVPVTEEEVVVEKRPVAKEEIRIRKDVTEVFEEDPLAPEVEVDEDIERRNR